MFDLLIKNGRIIDGTGDRPFKGDIAIQRDRILEIGHFEEKHARLAIDASGLTVTPGLIDGHTHSELNLMYNRQYPNALYQGISTVITGQCGLGFAPIPPEKLEEAIRFHSGIFGNDYRMLKPWNTFQEYLDRLNGCAVNAGSNVSHNAIRQSVCGYDNLPLTGKRLDRALKILDGAMSEGAKGMSVGLSYYPGGYSDTQELIELCRVVQKYDGIFCVHLRLDDHQLPLNPVREIAEVVRQTGVRLNMLHYRTGSMSQTVESLFEPFAGLEEKGMDIHYEFYPYLTGAGLLMALIPGWAQEGGPDETLERLADPAQKDRLLREMDERHKYFFDEGQTCRIILTEDPYSPDLGRTMDEIMAERSVGFSEAVRQLLIENHLQAGFAGVENQPEELKDKLYEDQYRLFMDRRYSIGSDTIPTGTLVHPRTFGAFARIIRMMRNHGAADEFIIHKLTALPAQIYRIENRGVLKKGNFADICLMDPEQITDRADFQDGRAGAEGVDTLLVNGLPVLRHGKITGVLPGHSV